MLVASVVLHAPPAELKATLAAGHFLAASILGDKHVALRARFGCHDNHQILFDVSQVSGRFFQTLEATNFLLQRIAPRYVAFRALKLIRTVDSAVLVQLQKPCVSAFSVRALPDISLLDNVVSKSQVAQNLDALQRFSILPFFLVSLPGVLH